MWSWPVILVLVLLIPFAVGYLLPWFSARILGPLVFGAVGILFVTLHRYFFPFQSDGSMAGLIVPGLLWAVSVLGCLCGVVLIATGVMRMRQAKELELAPSVPTPPSSNADADVTAGSDSSMLNVSLGIAVVIAPFLPLYLLVRPLDSLLYRGLGYVGLLTVQFLLSNGVAALLIYYGLRRAGLRRLFPPDAPGSRLIFVGSVVVLVFRVAELLRYVPGAGSVIYTVEMFSVLVWVAWSVVLMGLFLFWRSRLVSEARAA